METRLDEHAPTSAYRVWGKRLFDLAVGLPLALLALPLIGVLACFVILTSGWPPFYGARRLGLNGSTFRMWKLRTMVKDADTLPQRWQETQPELAQEYCANFKLRNDPRVTPLGRWLRRTSLDELPQLWNVLRGEMSLVGPRPYYAHELETHPEVLSAVTQVRPGLTGPWQVSGRNALVPEVRMELDRRYVTDRSFQADLLYLCRTVKTLLKANGV
jgi:lipopolysaccharide/colanic/teichoic acid biosynthesis glycosyltransferase